MRQRFADEKTTPALPSITSVIESSPPTPHPFTHTPAAPAALICIEESGGWGMLYFPRPLGNILQKK